MKNFKILLLVFLLLITSTYMVNRYRPQRVDLVVDAPIGRALSKDLQAIYIYNCAIEYSMRYGKHNLIMAQGNLHTFDDLKILPGGKNYFNGSESEIILGEKASNHYFKSNDVIGKKLYIYNKEYKVIGVAKNSKSIIIPYQEKLKNRDWHKIVFKARSNDLVDQETLINSVRSYMQRINVDIIRAIKYSSYIYVDVIIIAFIFIVYLYTALRRYLSVFIREVISFKTDYDDLIMELKLSKVLKQLRLNILYIGLVLGYLVAISIILYGSLSFFKDYGFSDFLINLINTGIVDSIKNIGNGFMDRLRYGFEEVELVLIVANFLCIVSYIAILKVGAFMGPYIKRGVNRCSGLVSNKINIKRKRKSSMSA